MKLSQFRGKDRRNMILILLIIMVVIAVVAIAAFFWVKPRMAAKVQQVQLEQEQENQEAAAEVAVLIDEIGEVTAESGPAIESSRSAYDALSKAQKELVANYSVLTDAENLYAELTESLSEEPAAEERQEEQDAQNETETAIHRYEYIVEDCTWSDAVSRCREKGGYLANINSQEELDHIIDEINGAGLDDKIFYLGGKRDNGSDYYWMNMDGELYGDVLNGNGDVWCSTAWMQGEPSFYDGDTEENVMALFYYKSEGRWVLNDEPNDILAVASYYSGKIGYICEYDD